MRKLIDNKTQTLILGARGFEKANLQTEGFIMYDYLTKEDVKAIRNDSKANGWEPLPIKGANNRAYYRHNGNVIQLKSYNTIVFEYDTTTGECARKWGGYSATTLKHVEMFRCWLANIPYRRNTTWGKANWDSMPVE